MRPAETCDACGVAGRGRVRLALMVDGLLELRADLCEPHADDVREAVRRTVRAIEERRPSSRSMLRLRG